MSGPHVRPDQVSRDVLDPDLVVLFPRRFEVVALLLLAVAGAGAMAAAPRFVESDSVLIRPLFFAGAVLLALAALQMLWRLFRPRPVLIADSAGVADYTFPGSPVFLRWRDMGGVSVWSESGARRSGRQSRVLQRFLVIEARPGATVSGELTGFQRVVRRLKTGEALSDSIRVGENLVPIDLDQLRDHLEAMWRRRLE